MTPLTIVLDLDEHPWTDLEHDDGEPPSTRLVLADVEQVGALPNATEGGHPVVFVRATLADGSVVVAQTTLALYVSAAEAMLARHGDPRT